MGNFISGINRSYSPILRTYRVKWKLSEETLKGDTIHSALQERYSKEYIKENMIAFRVINANYLDTSYDDYIDWIY